MSKEKRKALIKIIVGIIFTVVSLSCIVSLILESSNSILIFVTLSIGICFLYIGKRQYRVSDKYSKFERWNEK